MGKMSLMISDELEERFRRAVGKRKGFHKGNIGEALSEAIEDWINKK